MRICHIRKLLLYTAVFVLTAAVLTGALLLSALIPKSAVRDNMLSSAELLCEHRVFFELQKDIPASKIDRYADSILLNIAYHYDSEEPLRSVMLSEYYYTDIQNENDNLRDALRSQLAANTQYLRYWHGSAALVIAAHTFTDIGGMYIMNIAVITLLMIFLLYMLIKRGLYGGALGTLLALLAAGIWFTGFSLEYSWVFVITLIMSVIAVSLVSGDKTELLPPLFLVCGIVTNYLDFLTAETLTLTFPLLLTVYIRHEDHVRKNAAFALKNTVLWGAGYAGMWLTKWLLAALVLGEDVMPYIGEHISERIGDAGENGAAAYIFGAVRDNISCLFPLGYGGAGVIAAVILLIAAAYICFVYRRKGISGAKILLYAAIGAVPYVRYAVLHNHSYLHYFFTYRAQAASVLAVCMIIYEITGGYELGSSKRKHP